MYWYKGYAVECYGHLFQINYNGKTHIFEDSIEVENFINEIAEPTEPEEDIEI